MAINPVVVALIAWVAVFGIAAARFAEQRERVGTIWFAFGAILGPIALAVLYAAPPGRCRTCMIPTRGWQTTCAWCHEDVRVDPAPTRELLARLTATSKERERAAAQHAVSPTPPATIRGAGLTTGPGPGPATTPGTTQSATPVRPEGASTVELGAQRSPHPAAVTGDSHRAPAPPRSSRPDGDPVEVGAMATATYVTGSSSLTPGARYVIGVNRGRLRVHGPMDVDPSVLAVAFDIADAMATTVGGRILISQHMDGSGAIMAFMQVAGMTPDGLAAAVTDAAHSAARP